MLQPTNVPKLQGAGSDAKTSHISAVPSHHRNHKNVLHDAKTATEMCSLNFKRQLGIAVKRNSSFGIYA